MNLPVWRLSHRKAGERPRQFGRMMTLELLERRQLLAIGPAVEGVAPPAGSHSALLTADVSATYDQDIDPASANDATFAVHAMQSGRLLQPDNVISVSGPTITLDAAADFKPGELVQTTATIGVRNPHGDAAPAPFVWQFRTETAAGSGDFLDSGQDLGDSQSLAVALGDLDADGDLDAFVTNRGADARSKVWLNDGSGRFIDSGQVLDIFDCLAAALGDVDADGDLDALVLNQQESNVWLNDGQGNLSGSDQRIEQGEFGVALGDLDGDGDLDAFLTETFSCRVWFNDGQGRFSDSGQSFGGSLSYGVKLGDMDGDGDLDAVVAHAGGPNAVYLNDGGGFFDNGFPFLSGFTGSGSVDLGDLDGDGNLDVVLGTWREPIQVWLGDGHGQVVLTQQTPESTWTADVVLGDLDADGDLDLFETNGRNGGSDPYPSKVWLNDGTGRFVDSGQLLDNQGYGDAALGDLDGDGDLDAFVANGFHRLTERRGNKVWLNEPADQPSAEVLGRYVFYNDSVFDGDDPAANAADDQAIAPDKAALLPGQTATFANYTSYCLGINGVMVDVAGLPGVPTADDFEFVVGNDDNPAGWFACPQPSGVTVRPGDGVDGSDRITLVWPHNVIQKQWLQVTVLATPHTGLVEPDVFYFGNAIAETGNSTIDAKVNAIDMLRARDNQRSILDPAPIDFPFDFDRDARVTAIDMLIAVPTQTHFLNALRLITVPGDAAEAAAEKQYEPNQPVGQAKGLHPGRVTWVHNPDSTSWNGSSNYWWYDSNTDPVVVEEMLSDGIRWQAGRLDDAEAWEAIFRDFNQTRYGQDVGYTPGDKLALKVNMNTVSSHGDRDNTVDMSPQVVRALVRQLVNQGGVLPDDITIFDASRYIPDRLYDPIHAEFPQVRFVDSSGGNGRVRAQPDTTPENLIRLSGGTRETLRLPTCVTEARYVINVANLKQHTLAGMTMTAKNCFGAIMQFNNGQWQWSPSRLHSYVSGTDPMGRYDALVDLVGHRHLGGKTMLYLIDGLYGAMGQSATPRRWSSFGNDWTSSLLLSQDPMAIDSVALDFLRTETGVMRSTENYLHEGALVDNPPSGVDYDPHNDGTPLASLGVHEHWNNANDKQYTRNLGAGEGIELVAQEPIPPAEVVARHVFYNNSVFDGNDPAANAADDLAMATDKAAALPGETIGFANYTSFSRGINGVMVDIAGLPQGVFPQANDFGFRVGNTPNPNTWAAAPDPASVSIRPGEGAQGSDRVTIVWADNHVQKQWLQVTVLANKDTWLAEDDVFYFGNAIGECGNSTSDAKVNAVDMLAARDNTRSMIDPAPIDFPFDYNRDARVGAADMLIARNSQTHLLSALNLKLTEVVTALLEEGTPLSYRVPTAGDAGLGTDWAAADFDDSAWAGADQVREVLISEAGTGDPDFAEIQNVAEDAVDTAGWFVVVNNAWDVGQPVDINAFHATLWDLPDSMAAGEVLYRSDVDDGSGNWWGENIFWRTSGSGWVMLVDDRGEVADFVVWGYSEPEIASLDINVRGHQLTAAGAWSGPAGPINGSNELSLQRAGQADRDNAADWDHTAVTMGQQNVDLTVPFLPGITTGIGFSTHPDGFGGAIATDVGPQMQGQNASLWTRIAFDAADPAGLDVLQLQIKYNDGFVALLNGQEIARRNAPAQPQWNSTATASRPYLESSLFETIDVTGSLSALTAGENVLAIHGLNDSAADGEFVVLPVLVGKSFLPVAPDAQQKAIDKFLTEDWPP